jgi:polyisoprenoid-binding protein YceI
MKKFVLGLAAAALLSVSAVNATEYGFDKAHSSVGFTVKHLLSKVSGSFTDYDGTINFDPKNPTAAKVKVTIQAKSISTGVEKRDGHLRSPDFFDVAKFPTLTFVSTKVEKGADDSHFKVTGDLTIHGVTKSVVLDTEFGGTDNAMGADIVGFSATTKIDRRVFGLTWGEEMMSTAKNLMVGNDVTINIEVAGMDKAAMKKMAEKKKDAVKK